MDKSTSTEKRSAILEIVAAVVLGVLAVGAFILQAYWFDAKTTQRETGLFNTLQFLLTLGFGWFSTRAVSRAEFERSLKQFAIGAYRRITDIEAMIDRLRARIHSGNASTEESTTNLAVVASVLEDTLLVVRSSTADWADVIGEELLALQKIQDLRKEKVELNSLPALEESMRSADRRIEEIDVKIEGLTKRLPPNLQIESRRAEADEKMREHQVEWMRQRHEDDDGLLLRVVAGGRYSTRPDEAVPTADSELFAVIGKTGANIEDASGVMIGRVLNNTPMDYMEFTSRLSECFGTGKISVRFVKALSKRQDKDALHHWYQVKVLVSPVAKTERPPTGLQGHYKGRHSQANDRTSAV